MTGRDEIYQQRFQLQVDAANLTTASAALLIAASVSAEGYVEVKDEGTLADGTVANDWHILNHYVLHYLDGASPSYLAGQGCRLPAVAQRHQLLAQIDHYGKDGVGAPLNRYRFDYTADCRTVRGDSANVTTNNVRLTRADNGWGGAVEFAYFGRKLSNQECNYREVCKFNEDRRYRFVVTRESVLDGLGQQIVTDYTYEEPILRGEVRNRKPYDQEFVGFRRSTALHYEITPETAQPTQEVLYEVSEFWQAVLSPDGDNRSTPRDPRSGKRKLHQVFSPVQPQCNGEQPGGQRCLLQETKESWSAYYLTTAGDWQAWQETLSPAELARPVWAPQTSVTT